MNNFVGYGEMLNHTLTAAVSSGDGVIIGSKAGIAVTDGEIGDIIAIRMIGVVNMPLKSGGAALPLGTIVSLNDTDGVTGGAAAIGDIEGFGYVAEDGSAATDDTVAVKLTESAQTLKVA